jgi:alpha-D-xyloside xylohydrolase
VSRLRVLNGYYYEKGVTLTYPEKLYEYSIVGHKLVIDALFYSEPNFKLQLGGRVIRFEITSPREGIIRMRVTHQKQDHQKQVKFPLRTEIFDNVRFQENGESITFSSGALTLKFNQEKWRFELCSGETGICFSEGKGFGLIELDGGKALMAGKLSLDPDELIYGLGERYTSFIKNGQSVTIWNEDAGTNTDMTYKNIPFYLSNKGYGLFINSTERVEYEIGTEEVNAIKFTVPDRELDCYFIYGPTPKEILERYTWLSGRAPIIPKWSLGLWLSTSFLTDYNERIVTENIERMTENDIQVSVVHFDCYWMKERHWCDFEWDKKAFPEPEKMLEQLKARGLKICLWINPYISELSSIFDEGVAQGYFLKRQDGSVYQIDWWQPGIAFVDFTNPEACDWYREKLRSLLLMGVDSFKTDFGESVPEDALFFNGQSGKKMHNLYTLIYNQTVFELLEETFGKGNALVFARSATACSQKYPVHWGGDSATTFDSMVGQLRGGLSFLLSGGAFWSHDIGGFYGELNPGVFKAGSRSACCLRTADYTDVKATGSPGCMMKRRFWYYGSSPR